MRVNIGQLAKALKSLAPVYLISGDEPLQLNEAADAIRFAGKEAGYISREIFTVDSHFNWNEFIAIATSGSIFSEKKIIDLRIPSGAPGQAGGKAIVELCQQANPDNLILITLPKIDKKSQQARWFQAMDKVGVVVQIWPLQGDAFFQWLKARAVSRGVQLDLAAAKGLASRTEGNLLAAAQEIEKLYGLYGSEPIDLNALESVVADSSRFDVYSLTKPLLTGQLKRTDKILQGLKAEAIAPPVLVWAIAKELRILIRILTGLQRGESKPVIYRELGLWEQRQRDIEVLLPNLQLNTVFQALLMSAKADRQIKGQESGDCWETFLAIGYLFHCAAQSKSNKKR